jgi:hypothetical protein
MEAYALVAAARKTGGNTLQRVAAEAMRVEGHCAHVKIPKPPSLIYGESPLLLVKDHEDRANKAKTLYWHRPSGTYMKRRQRRDRPVAVAGVISVPDHWEPSEPRWQLFKEISSAWLAMQFGAQHLHCIIEHADERCLHLHYFLNPMEHEDISSVHPGFNAVRTLATLASPREKKAAFENAMRSLLDRFHEEVGQRFGLVRRHIGAKRMTRKDWHIWNWFRQRARIQNERLAQLISNVNETKPWTRRGQLESKAKDANESMGTDTSLVEPTSTSLGIVDMRVGDGKGSDAGFLVSRAKSKSVEFNFTDLNDCNPSPNYSWQRPRVS